MRGVFDRAFKVGSHDGVTLYAVPKTGLTEANRLLIKDYTANDESTFANAPYLAALVANVAPGTNFENMATTYFDLKGRVPSISFAFNGNGGLSDLYYTDANGNRQIATSLTNRKNGTFGMCHTTGGGFKAGEIYWCFDNTAEWTQAQNLNAEHTGPKPALVYVSTARHCTTQFGFVGSGGSFVMESNTMYQWSVEQNKWTKVCCASGAPGSSDADVTIKVPFAFDTANGRAVSTQRIPKNLDEVGQTKPVCIKRAVCVIEEAFDTTYNWNVNVDGCWSHQLLGQGVGMDQKYAAQYDNDEILLPVEGSPLVDGQVVVECTSGAPSGTCGTGYALVTYGKMVS